MCGCSVRGNEAGHLIGSGFGAALGLGGQEVIHIVDPPDKHGQVQEEVGDCVVVLATIQDWHDHRAHGMLWLQLRQVRSPAAVTLHCQRRHTCHA